MSRSLQVALWVGCGIAGLLHLPRAVSCAQDGIGGAFASASGELTTRAERSFTAQDTVVAGRGGDDGVGT